MLFKIHCLKELWGSGDTDFGCRVNTGRREGYSNNNYAGSSAVPQQQDEFNNNNFSTPRSSRIIGESKPTQQGLVKKKASGTSPAPSRRSFDISLKRTVGNGVRSTEC